MTIIAFTSSKYSEKALQSPFYKLISPNSML